MAAEILTTSKGVLIEEIFINSNPDNQLQKYSIYKNKYWIKDHWIELQEKIGRKNRTFTSFGQQITIIAIGVLLLCVSREDMNKLKR